MAAEGDGPPVIQRDFRETNTSRKTITFIKGQSSSTLSTARPEGAKSLGDSYLSVVLPSTTISKERSSEEDDATVENEGPFCEICNLPISSSSSSPDSRPSFTHHESSLAHQVCLSHTHPPSSIDRSRKGLAYLKSYGWDPDARKGLGSTNREGILYPVAVKEKKNKAGIGAIIAPSKIKIEKVQKTNAKQTRLMAQQDKKKSERLRRMFYSSVDLEQYLGPEAL